MGRPGKGGKAIEKRQEGTLDGNLPAAGVARAERGGVRAKEKNGARELAGEPGDPERSANVAGDADDSVERSFAVSLRRYGALVSLRSPDRVMPRCRICGSGFALFRKITLNSCFLARNRNLLGAVVIQLFESGERASSQERVEGTRIRNHGEAVNMIHADEIRKDNGQMRFALAALGATHLQGKATIAKKSALTAADASTYQLNLSAERVLVGFAAAGGFIGIFMWALIRLWLFEP